MQDDTAQRVQVARSMLDAMRRFSVGLVPPDRFGADANDLALFAGLLIGTAEGRPMNATKLAHYVGIPRPSVIRKLDALTRRGLVERTGGGFVLVGASGLAESR
jgi:predicted Rossmann fold nucleotide-binding protein DprA/Smf involved in DNA uptake